MKVITSLCALIFLLGSQLSWSEEEHADKKINIVLSHEEIAILDIVQEYFDQVNQNLPSNDLRD